MTHTKTPWKVTYGTPDYPSSLIEANGQFICQTLAGSDKANADFIITAVNSHDDMLEALESLYRETVDALSMFDNNPSDKLEDNEALKQARAAIAKAKS